MTDLPAADRAHVRLTRVGWTVFAGFGAVALFFLLTEHRAHVFGVLPFLLVAACPLMHLFHRHGHGDQRGTSMGSGGATPSEQSHEH